MKFCNAISGPVPLDIVLLSVQPASCGSLWCQCELEFTGHCDIIRAAYHFWPIMMSSVQLVCYGLRGIFRTGVTYRPWGCHQRNLSLIGQNFIPPLKFILAWNLLTIKWPLFMHNYSLYTFYLFTLYLCSCLVPSVVCITICQQNKSLLSKTEKHWLYKWK